MLAVTSDKSTLHVFDVPHPSKGARPDSSNPNRRLTSMGSGSPSPVGDEAPTQKWGILSRIPMLPRVFSDIYSFASAHFELGDATPQESGLLDSVSEASRPRKGLSVGQATTASSSSVLDVTGGGKNLSLQKVRMESAIASETAGRGTLARHEAALDRYL
ncbi:Phosphatidylinositol 3,5-bisphosphate-binding protein [Pseudogymnoascus australis]